MKCLFACAAITAAACAGCTNHPDSEEHATVSVLDPETANAEVAGYVKLAKEYISRQNFNKAVEVLERAVSVQGATEKTSAANLLAAVQPLQAKEGVLPSVNADRYSSSMGPVEVVHGYLASTTWQDRVAFVLRPHETGPIMASTYQNTQFDPSKWRPGKVFPPEKQNIAVGLRMMVTVDMSESSPENPSWQYVVERTGDGYKIDWQASQALSWAEEEAAARRALQLDNPVLETRVLRIEDRYGSAVMHVRITNRSNKFLATWQLALELTDRSGEYLAAESITGFNLLAGQGLIEKVHFSKPRGKSDWLSRILD